MCEILSEAERDLAVLAGTELDIEPLFAYDPEVDPPVDTLAGRWARGEVELELVAACERQIAFLHAMQARALVRFAGVRPSYGDVGISKYAADEIGLATRWTTTYASSRLGLALTLTDRLPATLAALGRGDIDIRRAQKLADLTASVPAHVAGEVERAVLPEAVEQNTSQLARAVRKQIMTLDPEGAAKRHVERKKERRVELVHDDDAMAELRAVLPAPDAERIYHTLVTFGRAAKTRGDKRTADQRRADIFCDLLLAHSTNGNGKGGAQVQVTVPASTLMGLDNQPGELARYGPIPADLARELAADGTWRRLLTDPLSGVLLDYGRTTYRPPAGLADFVRARDRRCVFPGCSQPATCCDLDHNECYPDGPTSACNLACLCRRHHRMKHETDWTLTRDGDRFIWTTPARLQYVRKPEPLTPPTPQSLPDAERPPDDEPPPF